MEQLTNSDIVSGILLFSRLRSFSEQAFFQLFTQLKEAHPHRDFGVKSVSRTLSFLEMHYILLPPTVYGGSDTRYRFNHDFCDPLRTELAKEGILPRCETLFRDLAARFEALTAAQAEQQRASN